MTSNDIARMQNVWMRRTEIDMAHIEELESVIRNICMVLDDDNGPKLERIRKIVEAAIEDMAD